MAKPWEWEKDHGFNDKGRQRKEACLAITECPKCGQLVELVAETEEWVRQRGKWVHSEYGPATGWCCNLAIIDSFDGCFALEFPEPTNDA